MRNQSGGALTHLIGDNSGPLFQINGLLFSGLALASRTSAAERALASL